MVLHKSFFLRSFCFSDPDFVVNFIFTFSKILKHVLGNHMFLVFLVKTCCQTYRKLFKIKENTQCLCGLRVRVLTCFLIMVIKASIVLFFIWFQTGNFVSFDIK